MATYLKTGLSQGNVKPGIFTIYTKVEFGNHPMAINDIFQLAKLKAGWILLGSWYRAVSAPTSTGTMDIGTTKAGTGQEVAAGVDVDAIGNTIWNAGTIAPTATEVVDADSYLTIEALTAAMTNGEIEIVLMVFASPADSEPADMDIS